jgi:hypothetical protein
MLSVSFNKEVFVNEINNYIEEYKLILISFSDREEEQDIRFFQLLKNTCNIKIFDEVKIERKLTNDMVNLSNITCFLDYGMSMFDIYKPNSDTLKLLYYLRNTFQSSIYSFADENEYESDFIIFID